MADRSVIVPSATRARMISFSPVESRVLRSKYAVGEMVDYGFGPVTAVH